MYYAIKINRMYVARDGDEWYFTPELGWAYFMLYSQISKIQEINIDGTTYKINPSMFVKVEIKEVK